LLHEQQLPVDKSLMEQLMITALKLVLPISCQPLSCYRVVQRAFAKEHFK